MFRKVQLQLDEGAFDPGVPIVRQLFILPCTQSAGRDLTFEVSSFPHPSNFCGAFC